MQSKLIPEVKNEFFQECKAGLVRITTEDDFIFAQTPRIEILDIKMTGNQEIFGNSYAAYQGESMGRDGIIQVRYDNDAIHIGGRAVTVIDGLITI